MHLHNVGEIIATRKLSLLCEDGTIQEIVVKVGKPQQFPDSSDYYCPFQITGIGKEKVRYAGGVDAIQALQLAMRMVGVLLDALNEDHGGGLMWLQGYKDGHHGFPS